MNVTCYQFKRKPKQICFCWFSYMYPVSSNSDHGPYLLPLQKLTDLHLQFPLFDEYRKPSFDQLPLKLLHNTINTNTTLKKMVLKFSVERNLSFLNMAFIVKNLQASHVLTTAAWD